MNPITVENLKYSYANGKEALKGLNFSIESGQTTALVGPNGAGKSTLLLCLIGILKGEGTIKIFDTDIHSKGFNDVRKRVGFVFQDPDDQLFMPTLMDDVCFGPLNLGLTPDEAKDKAKAALKSVGLENEINTSPHHLSYGQKKRAGIASILVMEPDILIFDEPTANLDPHSRRQLMRLLSELPQTKLIATHDLEMAVELCSRTLLLDGGLIVSDSSTDELFANRELLEDHWLEQPLSVKYKDLL